MTEDKYDARAERWSELAYADAATYLAHRGELVLKLGPPLARGDAVLDLACGDAGAPTICREFATRPRCERGDGQGRKSRATSCLAT